MPVVALAELYFYSFQYDRYFSSSHFVRISIALKEYICGMNYSRGWRIPLPYTDGKQERWRAIALLAVLGDRNIAFSSVLRGGRLALSQCSSKRKRRW